MRVCVRVPPYARPRACAFVRACVQGKGAKGASNAGGACSCVCAGVVCVRDGVRVDGAGVRCLSVSVCVGVIVLSVCVRV